MAGRQIALYNIRTTGSTDGQIITTDTSTVFWSNTAPGGPKIVSVQIANSSYQAIDDTTFNTDTGGYIIVTGVGFESGCIVGTDGYSASSTTFVNSTTLRAQLQSRNAGTYSLYVTNPDGAAAILIGSITYVVPNYSIELLMVAGGGGGGAGTSGGGGAGGLLYYGTETPKTPNGDALTVSPNTAYSIVIGAGGTRGSLGGPASANGSNTTFIGGAHSLTAIGGGGSGHVYSSGGFSTAGKAGGSGGGGSQYGGYTAAAGTGTTGQGFNGGTYGNDSTCGGGGGGAGGAGVAAASGGQGGVGLQYSISGTATYYAGGGGGGGSGVIRSGGSGGGGSSGTSGDAGNGTVNTGGGGGGGYDYATGEGGNGGSGVLILRYSGSQRGTGGTVTSSGGYTVHTFTSNGTFTA